MIRAPSSSAYDRRHVLVSFDIMEKGRDAGVKEEIFRTAAGILYWEQGFFWRFINSEGYELQPRDTQEFMAHALPLIEGRKAPLLLDRRHSYSPSFEALSFLRAIAPTCFTAIGYYAPTPEARAASELVRRFFLDALPVEIFADEDDAIRWLMKFAG